MEKNISKKLFAGVCALSAAFILASCDPISAVPSKYNDEIVLGVEDEDNKLGKIYDAIATDRNTKIVSDLLDKVATEKFGSYKNIQDAHTNATGVELKKYIDSHKSVFWRDGDDKVEGKDVDQVRAQRFEIFYEDIMDRISEFFYNEITSGSYNDDEGRFDETKLYMAHYYEFFDITYPKNEDGSLKENSFFVTNAISKTTRFFEEGKLIGNYSNPEGRGYIEEKVFPQILKDKLVEEYVYNNNYNSLGRAYARKVNYIKVSYETDIFSWDLLKNFADRFIVGIDPLDINFEVISKAIKGFDDVGSLKGAANEGIKKLDAIEGVSNVGVAAQQLLDKTIQKDPSAPIYDKTNCVIVDSASIAKHYTLDDVVLVPEGHYYKDTKLGELLESYEKAIKAEESGRFPIASDKAELDKFTASGKSKVYGLREKLISLAKEDYTTDGWFVKNGGLSELPSALRDRLFNINVANDFDDPDALADEHPAYADKEDTMGSYENNGSKRLPYMRKINGNKFVIPAKSQTYAENHYNYLYQDVDGKAFYIVQVLEAPSTPKLNPISGTYYGDALKAEEIARSVAKVLGTKDSYIKDAYTKELEAYKDSFVFYETSLYEHFKSEYPDLFDNED